MDKETRAQLEAPFPRELHRTRRGAHGKTLHYVEVARVIERLNSALSADWNFTIEMHEVRDDEVLVLGKLAAGGVVRMAFGSSPITLARDSGKPVSIGDDCKSAASDCLKKAASTLGVGLDLAFDGSEDHDIEPAARAAPQNVRTLRPKEPLATKPSPATQSGSSTDGKLTSRQAVAIRKLGEQLGMSEPDVKTMILKRAGVPLDRLSTRAASEIIGALQAMLTGRPGRASAGGAA